MSTEKEREGYRSRLSTGDIVYFVDGETAPGTGDLTVKKGSVTINEPDRRYPYVAPWPDPSTDPHGIGAGVAKSPRDLFTHEEVMRILVQTEGPLGIDTRPVDELLVDPLACRELTSLLGEKSLSRLIDDELRNPGDPEH